jgi:hypothetical protein
MDDERQIRNQQGVLKKLLIGCVLLPVLCGLILLIGYLWAFQPWLPYTEPEIQHLLESLDSDARLIRLTQETETCWTAMASIPSGTMHVLVRREDDHWKYVNHTFGAGGLIPPIDCPR